YSEMMEESMRKRMAWFGLLILILIAKTALTEVQITADPEKARIGEIIDIQVKSDGQPIKVVYTLQCNGATVFEGKEDTHFLSAFRPRQEGDFLVEARVEYGDGTTENGSTRITVEGKTEETEQEIIYSQKDGSWKDKVYAKSDLENAGCAIFTLSHALKRMGWTGKEILPENLAVTYRKCYTKNGTANARLIHESSLVYGFTTQSALFKQPAELKAALKNGDLFSFGIVIGHIALMSDIDEQAKKVKIMDSAPSATFERIKKGKIYYLQDGEYVEALDPGDIPGARYYFETGYYGGLEYYMDLAYCARRGGRLIRPAWLFWQGEEGKIGVSPVSIGIGESTFSVNGKETRAATRMLIWGDNESHQLAVVTEKKNIRLYNDEGKRIGSVSSCRILPVLHAEGDRIYVQDGENRGFVKAQEVELTDPVQGEIRKGVISVNGNTSGRATVKMRFGPSEKHKVIENLKTGTEVTLLKLENQFWQVDANGRRVWVHQDYVMTEGENTSDGTEINQGE
ncbi:MAG: SH3 domain-containing protein, partial [Lachnospiraceae bacterium]|nr:SH3 domain-containing protein [Lachnospiraceae bacterium]